MVGVCDLGFVVEVLVFVSVVQLLLAIALPFVIGLYSGVTWICYARCLS